MEWLICGAIILFWIVLPLGVFKRIAHATSLDNEPNIDPSPTPHVSIVLPVRNEEANIEDCVRAMLSSTYGSFDVLIVDDGSSDRTREIAQRIADSDPRARVIANEEMPEGWIGQQWALLVGSRRTKGDFVCFADADTRHGPEMMTRAINMMLRRDADLLTVACSQVLGSFWERVVQPQVLLVLGVRYGGTESISTATKEEWIFGGGPCMIARRDAYESVGGHEVARGYCATDVMLARGMFRNGSRVMMTHGGRHASIRMYSSLRELVGGWSKNIIMGTGMSANNLEFRDKLKNVVLLMIPLYELLPVVALIAGLVLGVPVLVAAGVACVAVVTALWIFIYRLSGVPLQHALMFAAGASVLTYILANSMARGKRFSWRGREYVSR